MKFQMSLIGDYGDVVKYAINKETLSGSLNMSVEHFGNPDGSVPDVIEVEITLPETESIEPEKERSEPEKE